MKSIKPFAETGVIFVIVCLLTMVVSALTENQDNNEIGEEYLESIFKEIIEEEKREAFNRSLRSVSTFRIKRSTTKFTPRTEEIGRDSNNNLRAYQILTERDRVPRHRALKLLQRRLSKFCTMPSITCDEVTRFRTIEGYCNNLQHPYWGASFIVFPRLLPASYADGYNKPRRGQSGTELPNVRLVSTTMHPDLIHPDLTITNMVPQLGQFVDHDMTLTPEEDKDCCTTEREFVDCLPIGIPKRDYFYSTVSTPQSCMAFTRSTPFCFPTETGIREQFNVLTAYLDASQVYGSETERGDQLRAFTRGRLRINSVNSTMLPTVMEVKEATKHVIEIDGKFLAGDERVNEMPALATMHTLLVREHNRLAQEIEISRPSWRDERIFQEARRILIAEWQNLVFGEYLPVILGNDTMVKYELQLTEGYSTYNRSVDATIFHSFATAAYRFGHTLINGIITLFKGAGETPGSYRLQDNFFESDQIEQNNGAGYDWILGGLMRQNAQTYDPFVTDALTNHLLKTREAEFGGDLIARNLQRGREHGLQSYNAYRQICKLISLTNWSTRPLEIKGDTWAKLQTLYSTPNDIDLFTGGISEVSVPGGVSGATFNCLKGIQFRRTKFGDRFFFTHGGQTGSFSSDQLRNIRRRTLGDIICDNSRVEATTFNVFKTASESNPMKLCNDTTRSKIDIKLFVTST